MASHVDSRSQRRHDRKQLFVRLFVAALAAVGVAFGFAALDHRFWILILGIAAAVPSPVVRT